MQKVIPGIGVRFDVVKQHPGCPGQLRQCQLRQGGALVQPPCLAALLHQGLGHQLGRHLPVLFAMGGQGVGQALGVGRRQVGQACDAGLHKQFPTLAANPTHLTEVALLAGLAIAEVPPGAKGAFFAVADQGGRPLALQVRRQAGEALVQLGAQGARQIYLFGSPGTGAAQHQALVHRRPLALGQQPAPQGQHQAMLPGDVVTLAGQHRLIAKRPPLAAPLLPK